MLQNHFKLLSIWYLVFISPFPASPPLNFASEPALLVINAIQTYNDKGGEVNLSVYNEGNDSIIKIEDFAGGIPEHIRDNIGKNILTTKGVSGTGFGLYLAYSVIKGDFGGEITFDTELGKGTTFYITIPR